MKTYVTFRDASAIRETEKAILCVWDGGEHWVPKSQVAEDSEVHEDGNSGDLIVTEWWAIQAKVL